MADDDGTRGGSQRVTIRDVARLANVSIGTVSKALNNNGSMRAETRERIAAVAKDLGFRPNDLAHSLHRGKTYTVGLISNDNFGRFSIPILEGLEESLSDSKMSVFMCNAADDPERESRHVEQLLGKRVEGIVVTARRADRRPRLRLPRSDVPVLYVFSQSDDGSDFCLLPDDEAGARQATEHLIARGRTRIAHVTGPERFEAVGKRRDGYRAALAAAGLALRDEDYLPGIWSEGWGREAVTQLFPARGAWPDAVFCGSDQIARGVADALRERGIPIPGAVSLVGFDNWEVIAEATRPPLTTIDMNLRELGHEAGRRMMDMIDGKRFTGVRRLPCSLVVRESCGARGGSGEVRT